MQDAAAKLITSIVRPVVGNDAEIAVVVQPLNRSGYYDNGEHY